MASKKLVPHGALQRLPYVHTASELQEMKFWRASVRESNRIADPVKRARNAAARLINLQLGKLSAATRQASLQFPALRQLQPFERDVVLLTLGSGVYEARVQQLRRVYAALHKAGKRHERASQDARTKQDAVDCGLRCVEELRQIVDEHAQELRDVTEMVKVLRKLPHVDLEKPIFAFVGAPNVGKSSLVRALSTASPEVANYPFTTRGITMGHIYVEGVTYQIADTPGLLYRPDASRNAIEKLALSMMEKTQAAVGFVFDPTGQSGTSVLDQLALRQELHERVTRTREDCQWLDIVSKIDQPSSGIDAIRAELGEAPHFLVSSQTNQGLAELGDAIRASLVAQRSPEDVVDMSDLSRL